MREFTTIFWDVDGTLLDFEYAQAAALKQCFHGINVKFTDRKRYYDAFDAFYRDNDAGVMIDLIAEYVDERLDEYLAVLSQ